MLFSLLGLDINFIVGKIHFFPLRINAFLNICEFIILHFISSQQYLFTMQKQHSRRNIFNVSFTGLQDHKEVKASPDFNLINIWYKIKNEICQIINLGILVVRLQFPFHDNGIITLFNGNALSDP